MAKYPRKPKKQDGDKEIVVAKYSFRGIIIVAIIGFLGTLATAYFGFLSNRLPPKSTPTPTDDLVIPTDSSLPQSSSPIFLRDASTGYIIILPACNCTYNIGAFETILVRLRWGAKTSELANRGAILISYTLTIDGEAISDLDKYREPAVLEKEPILDRDNPNEWWVYWDYPIKLNNSTNPHSIQATLKTLSAVDNGWNIIPANFTDQLQAAVELFEVHLPPP